MTTLYLHVFEWPKDGKLLVPGLGNEPIRARLIGTEARAGILQPRRSGSDIELAVPTKAPNEVCSVVALTVRGEPIVYETPEIIAPAREFVTSIPVELTAGKGLQVRYTTDGTDPASSRTAVHFRATLSIARTVTVKARAFHNGKPVSGLAEAAFTKVKPWPQLLPIKADPGLSVQEFRGDWNRMPDFSKLSPARRFIAGTISLGDYARQEYVGLRFEGFVSVPETESYVYELESDDGARLWIDDKLVVDNDGLHGALSKSGTAPLEKGYHAIAVEWFNKTGGTALELRMAKLGAKSVAVSATHLKH
jgi:hypothetical protein